MDVGGRQQKEQRQPRSATEQGVDAVATQQRAGMVVGRVADRRIRVGAVPRQDRRTIDDDIAAADQAGMAREVDQHDEDLLVDRRARALAPLALLRRTGYL